MSLHGRGNVLDTAAVEAKAMGFTPWNSFMLAGMRTIKMGLPVFILRPTDWILLKGGSIHVRSSLLPEH